MFESGVAPVDAFELDDAERDALPDGLSPDDLIQELSHSALVLAQEAFDDFEAEYDALVRAERHAEAFAIEQVLAVEQLQVFGEIEDLTGTQVLARAAEGQRTINLANAEQLVLAVQWADCNDGVVFPSTAPGRERLVQAGGEGTPMVAEFCAAEFGATVGLSARSAERLIADALDLRHRLPQLWLRVRTGEVPSWICRQIASRSRLLGSEAAARVDRRVVDLVGAVPVARLMRIVDAEILKADPVKAKADTEAAEQQQGVWVSEDNDHGIATLIGKAPAPDLLAVDCSLDELARALGSLGDESDHDTRRAKALALLANPEAALDVVKRAAEVAAGRATDRVRAPSGTAVLYVHLTDQTLPEAEGADSDAVARVESVGPALLEQVCQWLGHRNVLLKPVIDLPGMRPADCYEVPDRMAEALRLRTPASCFPFSSNLRRSGDNDHTEPFVRWDEGGPPGQTRLSNLGRLSRKEHRVKTHGGWTVYQPRSGCWVWTSPHGRSYLVDENGTHEFGSAQKVPEGSVG